MAADAPPSESALSGLRILDLTGNMGGYCGLLLANLGAEVILIEPPGGDPTRYAGPFSGDGADRERSLSFAAYHTNKRGIVLDLNEPEERRALRALASKADALIEDRAPGFLDQREIGYHTLRSVNPALVMTSITGFGQTGPYRDFQAPGIVAFAMGGLMNVCGHPGRAPLMGPCDVAYRLGALHAAFATLAALFNRRSTGFGDHVDVSLQDVLVADPFLRIITRFSVTGEIPQRTGHSQSTTVAETYQCRDGYARIFVNQTDHWRRFVDWLGRPPELLDPKYDKVQNRLPVREQINRLVEARTLNYDVEKFFEEFQGMRLAAAPINPPSAFLADEQTRQRSYVATAPHRHLGSYRFPGDPYKFSETPWRIERGAPLLGEHQSEIDGRWAKPSLWLGERLASKDLAAGKTGLEGIRVVSFPTGIVGPALAGLLAEHGAEVISIEPAAGAGRGLTQKFQLAADLEGYRDRKRLGLDMKSAEGVEIAKRLIVKSDVVLENFSARVMGSWGLDYARVREIHPRVIMASLQAFGHTGPRRDFVSFGPILMAFSGMAYLWRDPGVERPGAACQTAFPDYVAPSYGVLAVLAALHYRERTGKGQYIDLSQAESAASLIGPALLEHLVNGRDPEPQGNVGSMMAPHGCYRCKGEDRWCAIAVRSQDEWIRFCELSGHRDWLSDHRFAELPGRLQYRDELDYWIETWTSRYTPHQLMLILQRAGIAAGAVQTAEDLYRDPHLRERGAAREVFHPQLGWLTRAGPSARTACSAAPRESIAHVAGEDTEAVLGDILGMPRNEIRGLLDRQVVR